MHQALARALLLHVLPEGCAGGTAALPHCRGGHHQRYNWMVFNDFHITPSMPEEVAELYGGQKLPCLLYYTQVGGGGGAVVTDSEYLGCWCCSG